jgi:RNA polymerase sigma factor (sigma-70 family)
VQPNSATLYLTYSNQPMTDEELVTGCINKNPIAQKTLYDRFARKMMGVCLRYSESQEEAEDVLQIGFITVFEHIGTFKGLGSFEGWVRKIMVNTALTNIRKNKKFKQNVALDNVSFMLPSTNYVTENLAANDLLKLIKTLPPGFRTVFNLYAIEGYSHKEIGEMLNISEGTSKSQYSRAKVHLQKMIPNR